MLIYVMPIGAGIQQNAYYGEIYARAGLRQCITRKVAFSQCGESTHAVNFEMPPTAMDGICKSG